MLPLDIRIFEGSILCFGHVWATYHSRVFFGSRMGILYDITTNLGQVQWSAYRINRVFFSSFSSFKSQFGIHHISAQMTSRNLTVAGMILIIALA